jgi:hypothetical protein
MGRKPAKRVQPKLRLPESLHHRLERAAEKKGQSLNAEMVERLERSFEREEKLREHTEFLDAIEAAVAKGITKVNIDFQTRKEEGK